MNEIGKIVKDCLGYSWIIRDDSLVENCLQDRIGADINHEKIFLDKIIDFTENNFFINICTYNKDDTYFIDIGAHVGYYSIRLAKYFKRVIAIEPSKYNLDALIINRQLNSIKNMSICNFGLGAKEGESFIYERGAVSCLQETSHLYDIFDCIREKEKIEIYTLDHSLSPKIGIMKLDTEGMELDILRSGRKFLEDSKLLVLVEHHESRIKNNRDRIIKLFIDLGYKLIYTEISNESKIFFTNI